MGSKTKTYHVNMLKKYISREPEGNVVPVDATDGATVAVAGVIHQDVNPKMGKVQDPEGGHPEGTQEAKSGGELLEELRRLLRDLLQKYPDVLRDVSHKDWY